MDGHTRAVGWRSARRWEVKRHASGRRRGSPASGPTGSSWTRRPSVGWTRCGRSSGLTSPAREGQTFGGESLAIRYANFVKLPHTAFALPFALLGVLAACRRYAVTWRVLGRVVVVFTSARFGALGV